MKVQNYIINKSGYEIPIIYGEYTLLGLDYPENGVTTLSHDSVQYKELEKKALSKFNIRKIDGLRITSGNNHIFMYDFTEN